MKPSVRQRLGDAVFWLGFGLCCLLLMPACALLLCVRGLFSAADWCSRHIRGA